jgi:AraC-like DNA-binding protein
MPDFQTQFIRSLLAYGASRDIDSQKACALSGIPHKAFSGNALFTVSEAQTESLWKNLCHLSGDPLLGLHFGASMQLAALGVVGQVVQTSATVGEALSNAGTLLSLLTDMFTLRIEQEIKTFTIHLIHHPKKSEAYPITYRQMADYLMMFIIHELDGLLLQKMVPEQVSFPYALQDLHEYSRLFRCPVQQRRGGLCIELDNLYLELPVISANYELQQQLLAKVGGLLAGVGAGTLQSKIYSYLLTNSYLYTLSLEAVAANFNVSPRTLQRKLKEEGVSFLQIVDDVRRKLAVQYLSSGHYGIKDVAYTLGYTEQSAFIRAFKKWTGFTPGQYLHKQQALSTG